jgi:hypothetical protein
MNTAITVSFEFAPRLDLWYQLMIEVRPTPPPRLTFERSDALVAMAVREFVS